MNRTDANKIAETISSEHLLRMFQAAKENITDWTRRSRVNQSMTIGTAWNLLAKDFSVHTNYSTHGISNMILEFGDYLPDYLKPNREKTEKELPEPIHQEPDFSNFQDKEMCEKCYVEEATTHDGEHGGMLCNECWGDVNC